MMAHAELRNNRTRHFSFRMPNDLDEWLAAEVLRGTFKSHAAGIIAALYLYRMATEARRGEGDVSN